MSAAALPPLRLSGVSAAYGARRALQEVDLEVRPGEVVGLVGPNGSGKSTLLRVALGFLPPSEGTVELFGVPVDRLSPRERARRVAWVPQEEAPRDDVPLEEYVLYGRYAHLRRFESEGPSDRARVAEALRAADLADRARSGILSLSGGERQRALLARALVQEAPLLLLDEPTAHLDIGHQLDLLERARALARERSVAVLVALHDLNLAARYADRIVALFRGRKYSEGSPGSVLSEALLARVWGVRARLRRDPRSATPYLVPEAPLGPTPGPSRGPDRPGPVHVIGGGGAATAVLETLVEEGFEVSVGVLPLLDTDAETAERLDVPAILELPFAPIGPESRAALADALDRARAVVIAPAAVGTPNLANWQAVAERAGRTPLWMLRRPPAQRWDFSGGAGETIERTLRESGATTVSDPAELARRLRAALAPPPSPAGAPGGR